jgi:hypothetical protein
MPEERTLEQWQHYHAVTSSFWLNPFARQAFGEALQAPASLRQTLPYVRRMTQWALHDTGGLNQRFRYPVLRDEYAWALLSPWFEHQPPADIQQVLLSELVKTLGDPRHDHAGWLGVRREAIDLASRWLSARTMEAFFEILSHTQDDIGVYRRQFWQAYYNAGHITEAWIALGEEAAQALASIDTEHQLEYAKILGKISPNQCVLMIRMGDLLFCDWSHKGRLRAISIHAKQAPKLYQAQYELFELRFPTTLDFNGGLTDDPGLLHHDSARGGWQDQARQFIAQHLTINLPLIDLLPPHTT